MNGTFSTVINFGMLGLLRRLHRMQIQLTLEADSEVIEIKYPCSEPHKKKSGQEQDFNHLCEFGISNDRICEAVESAKVKAQQTMINLGMAEIQQKDISWNMPPIPPSHEVNLENIEEEEEDEDEEKVFYICPESLACN